MAVLSAVWSAYLCISNQCDAEPLLFQNATYIAVVLLDEVVLCFFP